MYLTHKMAGLLRFYRDNQQDIQLKTGGNVVYGKIKKLSFFFGPHIVLENGEGELMKIYLEDIDSKSILPASIEVDEEEKNKKIMLRKGVPKSLKMELWRNHFGNRYHGSCFVCKGQIKKDYFEAGHVVAVANGGTDTLENLRPVCITCNRSMGTENLEEFKREYH